MPRAVPVAASAARLVLPVDNPRMIVGWKHVADEQRVVGVVDREPALRFRTVGQHWRVHLTTWDGVEISQRQIDAVAARCSGPLEQLSFAPLAPSRSLRSVMPRVPDMSRHIPARRHERRAERRMLIAVVRPIVRREILDPLFDVHRGLSGLQRHGALNLVLRLRQIRAVEEREAVSGRFAEAASAATRPIPPRRGRSNPARARRRRRTVVRKAHEVPHVAVAIGDEHRVDRQPRVAG